MFRGNRAEAPTPDRAVAALRETCTPAARSALDLRSAVAVVLRDVADATGWTAGHGLLPGDEPGTWVSYRLWYPDDGLALGGLRRACFDAPPAPARGHLAAALGDAGPHWSGDLDGLAETATGDAAAAAGVVAAVGCPVYVAGAPVVLLEWFLATGRRPTGDVLAAVAHLATTLGEVAERPVVHGVPEQGILRNEVGRVRAVAALLRR